MCPDITAPAPGSTAARDTSRMTTPNDGIDATYTGCCPRCGSPRWVSVSLDGAWPRVPQCVPCGAYHETVLGPGSEQQLHIRRAEIRRSKAEKT
ncbi:MAG: hypothetical protein JWM10_792 [Myxococcaceae bacterium]|nr:hypothetical protein [Myxococcaceae bacterium]